MSDALNFVVNTIVTQYASNFVVNTIKYFSSFAAVKIGKKRVFFLPIFTAAKDEKYFSNTVCTVFTMKFNASTKRIP